VKVHLHPVVRVCRFRCGVDYGVKAVLPADRSDDCARSDRTMSMCPASRDEIICPTSSVEPAIGCSGPWAVCRSCTRAHPDGEVSRFGSESSCPRWREGGASSLRNFPLLRQCCSGPCANPCFCSNSPRSTPSNPQTTNGPTAAMTSTLTAVPSEARTVTVAQLALNACDKLKHGPQSQFSRCRRLQQPSRPSLDRQQPAADAIRSPSLGVSLNQSIQPSSHSMRLIQPVG
jgi:hypothetical protein